jgi:hypothetical protein
MLMLLTLVEISTHSPKSCQHKDGLPNATEAAKESSYRSNLLQASHAYKIRPEGLLTR